ncbi:MAG: hypothetical protein SWK76_06530 [Actinomycetota bacterium]|nr:hypothetical protein [Actinomycetota bacterium]
MKGFRKHIAASIAITAVFVVCALILGMASPGASPVQEERAAETASLEAFSNLDLADMISVEIPQSEALEAAAVAETAVAEEPAVAVDDNIPAVPGEESETADDNPEDVDTARPKDEEPEPAKRIINPPKDLRGEFVPGKTPQVRLSWDGNNPKKVVDAYLVYRQEVKEGGQENGDLEPIAKTRKTSYKDKDIEPGATYRYWVTAVARWGEESEPSEAMEVQTYNNLPPAPPQGVDVVAIDPGVSIDWEPNSEANLAGYNVYVQVHGRFRKINGQLLGDNHYYDKKGEAGTVFAVSAVNVYGVESEKVQVEARQSTPQIFEENDPSISAQGLWVDESYEGPTNGKIRVAEDLGSTLQFRFRGRQVKMIVAKYWSCGSANVYIDGEFVTEVNMYNPDTTYQVVDFNSAGLKYGEHVLTVEALGYGNPDTDHNFVNVDAFEVR